MNVSTHSTPRPWREILRELDGESAGAFEALLDQITTTCTSSLNAEVRELIHVATSTAVRSPGSIHHHLRRARDLAVSEENILHAILLGSLSGGVPSLAAGLQALDESTAAGP